MDKGDTPQILIGSQPLSSGIALHSCVDQRRLSNIGLDINSEKVPYNTERGLRPNNYASFDNLLADNIPPEVFKLRVRSVCTYSLA